MKRTNDILSYLLLLLLLMVTACTDEGREVASINQQMQESDLVELSIRTQVPEMEVGSRAVTERISAITAFAFSDESVLIKKVDATLTTSSDTTGTLKIKVPKRTRSIHFVAKNGDDYDAGNYTLGTTTLQDLLLNKTTTELHYWGMLTFADENALKANNLSLTLYRNMAKVVLELGEGLTGTIAGFLNYNGNGTLIPHDANGTLGYQANAVTLPEDKGVASHDSPQGLGTECFLSEHANDESNRLYAICYIGGKYYKIAFSNSSGVFFPLVRNHLYRIVINQISGGSDSYGEAKDADPINGNVREETLNVTSVPLTSYKGKTTQVTVTIPDGVTSLRVTSLPEQFDISSTEVTLTDNVCDVTGRQSVNFTLTLKDTYIGTTGTPNISFSGSGPSVSATGTGTVTLNGFMDMYEMYVDNSNLNGSQEYSDFFHTRNNTNVSNQSLTTEYVDAGANNSTLAHNHNTAAINMQNESSITFTIADTRYLTLLVAKSSDAPSINLQKDGRTWTETSEATTLPDNYNFAKEGDITTSGRLIRYTLEPGTYTLQRGNNDYDYLLYYMRVTTDKPIMTDIAQPLVTDYELAWSGGEFQDDEAKGYLKIDETNLKHIVNEDKLTHTVTLKSDGNSLNTSLNLNLTTFTLNKIDLNVATTRITFQSTNENNFNKKDTTQYITAQTNSCNIPKYNAGTYTLTGTIGNPKYKYEIFYDSLKLKSVAYEVKSPIEPGLYNSMEGNVLTPVEQFTSQDAAWAIGFKMPMVVPDLNVDPQNYQIGIYIPDWTISTEGDARGLGVIDNKNGNYTLGTQDDVNSNTMIHPREGWTYKIRWASVSHENIVPRLTGSDTDHYFTYKGTIAKEVTIPTPYEGVSNSLPITLNFSYDVDGNYNFTNSTNLNNLKLNTSRVRLTATIFSDDAQTYNEQTIQLNGSFSSNNSYGYNNSAIHWDNSRVNEGHIAYVDSVDHNGTKLQFTVQSGRTDYYIDWIFVTGSHYPGYGDIEFTYNVTNSQGSGNQSATIAFTNEPVGTEVWNGSHQWNEWSADNLLNIDKSLPAGTQVTLHFTTSDGKLEVHDSNTQSFRPNGIANDRYTVNGDDCFDVNNGETFVKFTLANAVNGLKINGNNVTMTKVVVVYPEGYVQEEENVIYTGPFTFTNWNNMRVDGTFTVGTKISFKFSQGGLFKIHNGSWQMLYIPSLKNRYPQEGYNRYIQVEAGEVLSFVVDNTIRFQTMDYNTNEQTGDVEFTGNSFSGLVLQGDGGTVLESITTITP